MEYYNNQLSCSPISKRHKKMIKIDDDLIGKVTTTATATISDLPEEVLGEVLKRLSVKDILTCVCVQKSWRSIIQTLVFIHLHSNYQNIINPNKYLLFWDYYNSTHIVRLDKQYIDEYLTLKFPPEFSNLVINKLISNGLICIYEHTSKTNHDIYLWNPFIQKYKTLPNAPHHRPYAHESTLWKAIAFGYVPKINDYLVVYVVKHGFGERPETHSFVTCVYSLNANSWRKISHANVSDVCRVNKHDSVFADGVAVWGGFNSQGKRIVMCFDTRTDVLRQVLLPECVYKDNCFPTILSFGQSIVYFAQYRYRYRCDKVSMWVSKGDLMNESLWEEKVFVDAPDDPLSDDDPDDFDYEAPSHVLGLRNNGDPILCNEYNMMSYNRDSCEYFGLGYIWHCWTPVPYWNNRMATPFDVKPFVESVALLNVD